MKPYRGLRAALLVALASCGLGVAAAQETAPGAFVETLLAIAKENNPEYAGMRHEAQAAAERVGPAGAWPDPKFRAELMDITKEGERSPTIWPNDVGSTRYTLMQDLPWFGKRDLRRAVAEFEADGAQGRVRGNWAELAARVKSTHALRYYHHRNQDLSREILDLMVSLEKIAQVRYAGGLSAQQDVIRAQIEQTSMRNELLQLEAEGRQMDARLNALLARPLDAPLAAPRRLRAVPEQLDARALQARVQANNPLLFADEARIRAAEKGRDLVYKNRYPDFTLSISPTQVQSTIKEWGLMVEVTIPLQQASRRSQEREAEAMLAAARARREASANQAQAELADQLAGLDAARQAGQLVQTSWLPQAELSFKAALAGYENGKLDFATLLDAQRQIRQARLSQLKAQYEAQVRLAEIEKLVGEDL